MLDSDYFEPVKTSKEAIRLEEQYGARNYHPLPVVLARGEGVFVWDVEGKKYYDFLSSYSALNQGHCHPRLIDILTKQAGLLTLTSRAFHNNILGLFEKYLSDYFGFEKVLPMNSGAEGVETAIKLCRKWAYEKKGIPENEAVIIVCENNFHGRTTTIVSFSTDPVARKNFGAFTPGFLIIPYNDLHALEEALKLPNLAGFLVEPIQGEAGVIVPDEEFIPKAWELCKKNNVLFIADEIQTGIARTGSLLGVCGNCSCIGFCERKDSYHKPDILILGKALAGGMYPVSAVLADSGIMDVLHPGEHGSTFGGNPLGCRISIEALQIITDEKLILHAREMGLKFRERLKTLDSKNPLIKCIRGKGLLNAIEINDAPQGTKAWEICLQFMENGLLAKPTHGNIIRLAPPLIITEKQLFECCDIIEKSIDSFK